MIFLRLWSSAGFLLTFAVLFWSGNFVLGRAVNETIPPVALAFWRWTGALCAVIVFALPHLRRDKETLFVEWRSVLLLSALGVAIFNTLVYIGLQTTTAINGVLMQSTMPVLILVGSFALFGERVRPRHIVAVVISMIGVGAIVAQGSVENLKSLSLRPGDAWIFTAVCCYALYSVMLRKRPAVHPLSFLAASFAIGAGMLLPFYLWEHSQVQAITLSLPVGAAVGYVALFPSLLSYLFFNRAVELIGANRAGQFIHLMPLFGSVLAFLLLGERLEGFHLAGAAMIAAGIGLANAK